MDFTQNENQRELAGLSKKIFTERPVASAKSASPDSVGGLEPVWRDLAGAGVLAAALPESLGGSGLGLLEQCSVLIEAGRALPPVPYLESIVLGAGALARFGTPEQQEKWAAPAGRGELVITAALAEEGADDPAVPVTWAEPAGRGGWTLSGVKTAVPYAPVAALLLVPVTTPDGVRVFLVEPGTPGVTIESQDLTSPGSAGRVILDGARAGAGSVLGGVSKEEGAPPSTPAAEWLAATATVGLCAYQAGVTAQALDLTAEYARTREQFGKPIGAFQAVAQRLADAYVDVQAITLTMWQAAWLLSEGLPAATEIATAKFWAADGGHRVAHTAVHVHGGVGIDMDAGTHRYFTAAKQNEFALGGATAQLLRIGAGLARA